MHCKPKAFTETSGEDPPAPEAQRARRRGPLRKLRAATEELKVLERVWLPLIVIEERGEEMRRQSEEQTQRNGRLTKEKTNRLNEQVPQLSQRTCSRDSATPVKRFHGQNWKDIQK